MKRTQKQRRRKALQKALFARIKIVNMAQRPTVVGNGCIVHAPFCGRDADGKPIYEKLTKRKGKQLQDVALQIIKDHADDIIAHINQREKTA